jgi:hypothetical protein
MFISEQHPISRRFVEFEDDGTTGYLYLTVAGERKVVRDCWLYNRIPAPDPSEIKKYRGSPPPAAQGHAGPDARQPTPPEDAVSFIWSSDGNAVCALIGGEPIGFMIFGEAGYGGFSRHLIREGPWGKPWDERRFTEVFGQPLR